MSFPTWSLSDKEDEEVEEEKESEKPQIIIFEKVYKKRNSLPLRNVC